MNPKIVRLLIAVYPRPWRQRYGAEFAALLEASDGNVFTLANVIRCAIVERLLPIRGTQETPASGFHCLCRRAPWMIFVVAPVVLLAGAYLTACLYLWAGWRAFVPGADTPFGIRSPMVSARHVYFIFGKLFYVAAPVLVGWGVGLVAARHRAKAIWPAAGLGLVAWIGGTARIFASRRAFPGGFGPIRMDFSVVPSMQGIGSVLPHVLTILALAAVPYGLLLWGAQRRCPG